MVMAFRTVTQTPRNRRPGVESHTACTAPSPTVLHQGESGGPVRRRRDRRSGTPYHPTGTQLPPRQHRPRPCADETTLRCVCPIGKIRGRPSEKSGGGEIRCRGNPVDKTDERMEALMRAYFAGALFRGWFLREVGALSGVPVCIAGMGVVSAAGSSCAARQVLKKQPPSIMAIIRTLFFICQASIIYFLSSKMTRV